MFRNRLDRAFFLLFAAIFALALGACQTKRAVRQPESVASESRRPVATTSTRPTPAKPTIEQLEPLADDPMLSVNTLHDAPEDYARTRIDSADYPVPLYAKYLKGVRICLNPGHGGDAHQRGFKRGPTGVREAEMNLRVALFLRDLLEHVGAEVLMTRTEDVDFTLPAARGQRPTTGPPTCSSRCTTTRSATNRRSTTPPSGITPRWTISPPISTSPATCVAD
jgi:hypothetical protein